MGFQIEIQAAPPAPPKESVVAGRTSDAFDFRRGYPILWGVRGAQGAGLGCFSALKHTYFQLETARGTPCPSKIQNTRGCVTFFEHSLLEMLPISSRFLIEGLDETQLTAGRLGRRRDRCGARAFFQNFFEKTGKKGPLFQFFYTGEMPVFGHKCFKSVFKKIFAKH